MLTLAAVAAAVALLSPKLAPPQALTTSGCGGTIELLVPVSEELSISLFEADLEAQDGLVNLALESTAPGSDEDPYGVVLWPAAQVVAGALMAEKRSYAGWSVLELGAGTGLCSLAAAAAGATAVATDYRDEPLDLLRAAADHNARRLGLVKLPLSTHRFDITDLATPLPQVQGPHVVVAADLLCACAPSLRRSAHVALGMWRCACDAHSAMLTWPAAVSLLPCPTAACMLESCLSQT